MMTNIEYSEEFITWKKKHVCSTPGCDRTLFLYRKNAGLLQCGIKMVCGEVWWGTPETEWEEFINREIDNGHAQASFSFLKKESKWVAAKDFAYDWLNDHSSHGEVMLESCQSHIGGFTRMVCTCGQKTVIDDW